MPTTGAGLRFVPIERGTRLSDRVAAQLLETIISQGLRPGDRLPAERDLAEQFEVSRTVIREAVRSLVGKGILEAHAGRGLSVAAVGPALVEQSVHLHVHGNDLIDYRKVHEVRAMLEVGIARLAAERATADEIDSMAEICDRMEGVLDDPEAASREDLAFHHAIAAATHNEMFPLLLTAIGSSLVVVRTMTFKGIADRPRVALDAHRRILEQIARHQIDESAREMWLHLVDVERAAERLAPDVRHDANGEAVSS